MTASDLENTGARVDDEKMLADALAVGRAAFGSASVPLRVPLPDVAPAVLKDAVARMGGAGYELNLDTVRCFLSAEFAGRGDELFGGLEVWADPAMRGLQGTVPVVALSFARVKGPRSTRRSRGCARWSAGPCATTTTCAGPPPSLTTSAPSSRACRTTCPTRFVQNAPLCLAFGTVLTVVALAGIRRATARAV